MHPFFNLQNHSTFHSQERLVNLERGRECFVGLSMLLVHDVCGIGEGLCVGHPGDCQHHHGHPAGPRHLPDSQVPAHHH